MNPDQNGALHLLLRETATWKNQLEAKQSPQMPLRQHLALQLIQTLRTNAGKLVDSPDTDPMHQTSVQQGIILADKSFPYHRWDPKLGKLVIDKKQPITSKAMYLLLEELQEMLQNPEMVIRFHALKPVTTQTTSMSPWRMQINLRLDRAWELLQKLAYNSVWMAVSASMKPHTLNQTPMADTIQTMLNPNKGKGKGKMKSKSLKDPAKNKS